MSFLEPGSDGELASGVNIWRKGLVYTKKSAIDAAYRVTVSFKTGASEPFTGYRELYRRVQTLATRATFESPSSVILRQGWQRFGENGKIAAAFLTLSVRCSEQGEPEPTEEALLSPAGATLELDAGDFYNEFDFTEPSDTGPVTLSYGESVSGVVDFRPFVERAERMAKSYHAFLQGLGETRSQAVKILRREWFLADKNFVTIHICFDR